MKRPRWKWRGHAPRPADDGTCCEWGGRCRGAHGWAMWCQRSGWSKCHRSDAGMAAAKAAKARSALEIAGMFARMAW
jgi:hypothetical protein